ncbi:hypothetical protein BAE46_00660 [Glaciecola punicea]|uniref:sulfurtransferase n=1 Tax=Glaciecola punicea TaxID=56804 RepID=UPI0008721AAA|nr:rhodanese-like domain-containing protein [Glaciecola punicea]OFA33257.1 hypothetical protein BAE46_00660 [Glaciecola punicea]
MPPTNTLISLSNFNLFYAKANSSKGTHVKILYTTMRDGPGLKPDIVRSHSNSYIPKSILFDFQVQFADPQSELSNTMVDIHKFANEADSLGIQNTDTLIIYDDYGNFCASRVWFMFKSMGHKDVRVLDGGLPGYLRAGLPTQDALHTPVANLKSTYTCVLDPAFSFVGKDFINNNLQAKTTTVLDARSEERFLGLSPETKPNVRAGHIPNSNSIHYVNIQDEHGHFLPLQALKEVFDPYKGAPLAFTCGSGVTACILAQAAYIAGINEIKVYDGSWSQWGADSSLPLSTGNT